MGLKPRGRKGSMDLDAAHGTGHGHHDEAAVQKAITHLWCQKETHQHMKISKYDFPKKSIKMSASKPSEPACHELLEVLFIFVHSLGKLLWLNF